jgi:hypothetical protein
LTAQGGQPRADEVLAPWLREQGVQGPAGSRRPHSSSVILRASRWAGEEQGEVVFERQLEALEAPELLDGEFLEAKGHEALLGGPSGEM